MAPLKRCLFLCTFLMCFLNSIYSTGFKEQYANIKADVASAGETEVNQLLQTAITEKKIDQALAITKEWLDLNSPKDPNFLYNAGYAAELIQEFEQAFSFYKSFLSKADLNSANASKAADSYANIAFNIDVNDRSGLQHQKLQDFLKYHKIKALWKYDSRYWQAITNYRNRAGVVAEMEFLSTCIESGVPVHVLKNQYIGMFNHVANSYYTNFNIVRGGGKYVPAEKASKRLAKLCAIDPELKALFEWKTAIYSYYLVRDKDKKSKAPIAELNTLLAFNPDYVVTVLDDATGGYNWGYQKGVNQKPKEEMLAIIKKSGIKASPFVQLYYGRYFGKDAKLPYAEDAAAKDKTFMASLKKPDLKATIKLIQSADPKKVSYLRYALEKQKWKVGKRTWNPLDVFRLGRETDARDSKERNPLRAALKSRIEKELSQNRVDIYLISAWFNSMPARGGYGNSRWGNTIPEDAELLRKIADSPTFTKLPLYQRSMFSYRYGLNENSEYQQERNQIAGDLKALTKESTADQVASALTKVIAGLENSTFKHGLIAAKQLGLLPKEIVADEKVYPLMLNYLKRFPTDHDRAILQIWRTIFNTILEKKQYDLLYGSTYYLWRATYHDIDRSVYAASLLTLTQKVAKENPVLAATLARSAIMLITANSNGRAYHYIRKNKGALQNILAKATEDMGISKIAVDKTDPSYPLFLSQQQLGLGNEGSAWQTLQEHSMHLMPVHRKLRVSYLIWVLEQLVKSNQKTEELLELRTELMKSCADWILAQGPFSEDEKVKLEILKGDIFLNDNESAKASAIYKAIIKNKDYEDVLEQSTAYLRLAKLEQAAKNYEAAISTIDELIQKNIPEFKTKALYTKAEIFFDKGDTEASSDIVKNILARDSGSNDAALLQSKILVKDKSFRPGFKVALGALDAQKWITTKEKLQITLNDPNMTASGGGTIIEVDVWSESGDLEKVVLAQSGDSKELFTGAILISLGKPNKNDSILQVIGDDKVQYAYNKEFARRMGMSDFGVSSNIRIKSDAEVFMSSKKLLGVAAQKAEDARILKKIKAFEKGYRDVGGTRIAKKDGEADSEKLLKANVEAEEEKAIAEIKRRLMPPIKPGNPVFLRVIDDDKSRTAAVDKLYVSVRTSSGDSVRRVELTETETHSGVFDGVVKTSFSQPGAASTSDETGNNPNSLISPKSKPWKSKPISKDSSVVLSIDLNDNIELGTLKIKNSDTSAPVVRFDLFTGMNIDDLTKVGTFPFSTLAKPYLPTLTIVRQPNPGHTTALDGLNPKALRRYLDHGAATSRCPYNKKNVLLKYPTLVTPKIIKNINGPSAAFSKVDMPREWNRNRANYAFIVSSFTASFYEAIDVERKFKITLGASTEKGVKGNKNKKQTGEVHGINLLVDGEIIATGKGDTLEGTIKLEPGVHNIEIISSGMSTALISGRICTIFSNKGIGGAMEKCQDSMFDPKNIPAYAMVHKNSPAKSIEKQGSDFVVSFANKSTARLIQVVFYNKNDNVISLDEVTLNKPDGTVVLPVKNDYRELAKNDTLELLIGDKITGLYKDDRFVGQKENEPGSSKPYEKFLKVSFSNGKIAVLKTNYRKEGKPAVVSYQRFKYGMELPITVEDADANATDGIDSIQVIVKVTGKSASKTITLKQFIGGDGHQHNEFRTVITPIDSLEKEKQRRALQAKESGEPVRPIINPMVVPKGGSLTFIFRDEENTIPGIPFDRVTGISHAVYKKPVMQIGSITTERLEIVEVKEGEKDPLRTVRVVDDLTPTGYEYNKRNPKREDKSKRVAHHAIKQRGKIRREFAMLESPPEGGFQFALGIPAEINITAPHLVLKSGTKIQVYLQSESTRKRFEAGDLIEEVSDFEFEAEEGDEEEEEEIIVEQSEKSKAIFNINMPGTITLNIRNAEGFYGYGGEGYSFKNFSPYPSAGPFGKTEPKGWGDGNFWFGVLIRTGDFQSVSHKQAKIEGRHIPLYVRPNGTVHVAFRYEDEMGQEQWLQETVKLKSDGFLDVMNQDYNQDCTNVFLGERAYVRVADMGRDISSDYDTATVLISSKSGVKTVMKLKETSVDHGGYFKGSFFLSYAKDKEEANAIIADPKNHTDGFYDPSIKGFPVVYGDTVRIRYKDSNGVIVPYRQISVASGADGDVMPFTKKFEDSEMAMETTFTLAECYLELAKRHRKMASDAKKNKQTNRSKRYKIASDIEFSSAKSMLGQAISAFTEPEAVAQGHYMLGILAYENANAISSKKNRVGREDGFQSALARFIKVASTFAETSYGSKAQFKKAITYEKLLEPDIAAAEYVKLAYKYPDSEFLGVAMARLGFHFLRKGKKQEIAYKKFIKSNKLEEHLKSRNVPEGVDHASWLNAKDMKESLDKEYFKAAKILSRMMTRFPSHDLAVKCGMTAGDCYRKTGKNDLAIRTYKVLSKNTAYESESRAQAMYWLGKIYFAEASGQMRGGNATDSAKAMKAYSTLMQITIDFPETTAAKWARAELSKDEMIELDKKVETERIMQ